MEYLKKLFDRPWKIQFNNNDNNCKVDNRNNINAKTRTTTLASELSVPLLVALQ